MYRIQTQILLQVFKCNAHNTMCRNWSRWVTCPFKSIEQLFHHPLTDIGLDKFMEDFKNSQK